MESTKKIIAYRVTVHECNVIVQDMLEVWEYLKDIEVGESLKITKIAMDEMSFIQLRELDGF